MTDGTNKKEKKYGKLIIKSLQYGIVTILLVGSYYLGKLQKAYETESQPKTEIPIVNTVKKDSINLAIDEGNNLLIIDNNTGRYTIYQDSIGYKIFKLYAGTIWKSDEH